MSDNDIVSYIFFMGGNKNYKSSPKLGNLGHLVPENELYIVFTLQVLSLNITRLQVQNKC